MNDIVARMYANKAAPLLKRTVIVGNKPGAGGLIAAQTVLRGDPQAALLVASNTFLIAAHVYKDAGYDPVRDFTPVTPLFTTSAVWVVRPDHPLKNLQDLVTYAKSNPGKLTYATNGVGTYSHLQMEMFKKRNGVDLTHVPFRSLPEGSMAVMGGVVDIAVDTPFAVAPRVKAGNLRPLAVFGPRREEAFPDVPTAEEAGFGEPDPLTIFCGLVVPSRAPAAYVEGLREASQQAIKDAEFVSQLRSGGVSPLAVPAAELSRIMTVQNERYADLIGALGISLT
ncbi:MAG: tripartite tricarboxylate transporter substrate binding protein [Reyranella sp.]|nr:tripartite tricarboxylate transporter substrate binding protein [Reyranella sp.]